MARLSKFTTEKKQQIVLSVLRGELSIAEAGRRFAASETSISKWR
ncbi:MAG TPA: helix-turn-helix domain-containing protein [Solirubrobacteraceae bacterium]|jgi:transposase-like protein